MLLPVALTLSLVAAEAPDASGIAWVHDDYAKAKAQANETGQLVAVDVWATWCHTCLSMKNFALREAGMAKAGKQHVWLALDFDRPDNAPFFAKIPVAVLPTFLVVDPKTDTVVARWVGSGTSAQMARFFESADKASKDPLVLGHRALAREDYKGARKIFEAALAKKPADVAERTKLLAGYIEALWKIDPKTCAKKGLEYLSQTDNTAPGIDFTSMVAMCAEELDEAGKKKALEAVRDRLAPIAADPTLEIAVDDRSGLYSALIDAYDALGDKESAEKALAARAKLLEDAAAAAKTQVERATFDAHRLEVYTRQGRFDEAEKMLIASENAQPADFNHPWRLAVMYSKQKKTDQGLAAIDRALQRGYGGRRLRLFSTKVDLLIQKKSYDAAKQTIAAAKAEINAMHKSQVRPAWVKDLDGKLAQIEKLEKSS